MLFFGVGGSGRRPVESTDPGGGPAWGCQDGTVVSGTLFSFNCLMVIEGPGLGTERGPKWIRGEFTFRGYIQSKSISGAGETHKAWDGVSNALSEVPGRTSGSHLDPFSIPPETILASERGSKQCLATILGKGCI